MSASVHSSASSFSVFCGCGCDVESERACVGDDTATEEDVASLSNVSDNPGSKLEGKAEEESTKDPNPSDSARA